MKTKSTLWAMLVMIAILSIICLIQWMIHGEVNEESVALSMSVVAVSLVIRRELTDINEDKE